MKTTHWGACSDTSPSIASHDLKSLANCLQHCEIKVLINLADVVFRRHGAMVMLMHYGPTLAFHITELSSINGVHTLNKF